jgi:peptide/nickel transport system permease protein
MIVFLARRIGAGIVLLFVMLTATFVMLSLTGTEPARNIIGETATPEQIAAKNHELGLDQPWLVQYWTWISGALRGDFQHSWFSGDPVFATLGQALPVTLSVVLVSLVLATLLSVVLGVAAAIKHGWLDKLLQLLSVIGFAVPSLLIALLLATVFAVQLGWFPATGYVELAADPNMWLKSITLPAIALTVGMIAATAMQIRGSMIDVLRQDYIRTLRSRGLSERSVLLKHALRNASPPALTVLSLQFISLLGGAVIIERVFGLSGIGSAAVTSSINGDRPLVLGIVTWMVIMVVVVNLLMDVAYGWINPKVRTS